MYVQFQLIVINVEKKRPMLIRKTGTGDMNVIGNQLKIPVITYGPGDPLEETIVDYLANNCHIPVLSSITLNCHSKLMGLSNEQI